MRIGGSGGRCAAWRDKKWYGHNATAVGDDGGSLLGEWSVGEDCWDSATLPLQTATVIATLSAPLPDHPHEVACAMHRAFHI